jgi:hypothetical protein
MFRETNTNGTVSKGQGDQGVLRYPDGSINFEAYRVAGRRAREAAIVSSITGAASFARNMLSWLWTAKSGSPAAKHQAHHAR